MGGRGSQMKASAAAIRKDALAWARTQVHSTAYAKQASLGEWKKNSWKCNAFVTRAFNTVSLSPVIGQKKTRMGLTQRAYSANEIYKGEFPNFQRVMIPPPGDICADGSHVGIVSGKGKTISASKEKVVENDWGFRPNAKNKSRFYRYMGEKQ